MEKFCAHLLRSWFIACQTCTAFSTNTVTRTAVKNGFSIFLSKPVTAVELVETRSGLAPLALFTPTNESFTKILAEMQNTVLANKPLLAKIPTYSRRSVQQLPS